MGMTTPVPYSFHAEKLMNLILLPFLILAIVHLLSDDGASRDGMPIGVEDEEFLVWVLAGKAFGDLPGVFLVLIHHGRRETTARVPDDVEGAILLKQCSTGAAVGGNEIVAHVVWLLGGWLW